jgi:hypothetical protein
MDDASLILRAKAQDIAWMIYMQKKRGNKIEVIGEDETLKALIEECLEFLKEEIEEEE